MALNKLMQTLDFRRWLENDITPGSINDPLAIKDPQGTAKLWHDNTPKESLQKIQTGIDKFANYMALPEFNNAALAEHMAGYIVNEPRYPDNPICGNLVKTQDHRLKFAKGIITNQKKTRI